MVKTIKVIGAGLAGTETAWQLAQAIQENRLDYQVELFEMRPKVKTPAHHTDNLAELVCSNSLGSEFLTTARGVLIHEMLEFDSLIINAAKYSKVPAGQALAVDRDKFAQYITEKIAEHKNITLIREEFTDDLEKYFKSDDYIVIATGPLTSPSLTNKIEELLSKISPIPNPQSPSPFLHFFDAASPIVSADSIDMGLAYKASRYGKGDEGSGTGDYINCPFYDQQEFDRFYEELVAAEKAPLKDFEKKSIKFFEGCMPIEEIANRGKQTMCFGPLKPVGLEDPRYPGRKAVAVVQLRQDNVLGSLYNIVGFQTNLKWGEQKRVFSMIPGLQNLDIVRYGVMHQNIFINSPLFLNSDLSLKFSNKGISDKGLGNRDLLSRIYFAGQITGVEGYTESAATGIVVARSIIQKISLIANPHSLFPSQTMLGALSNYIANADPKHFQPMNSNWGLINTEPDKLEKQYRKNKRLRQEFLANRALCLIQELKQEKASL